MKTEIRKEGVHEMSDKKNMRFALMAYDIDNNEFSDILGTIAGDDTIMLVLREGVATSKIRQLLSLIIPNIE